MSKRRLEPRVEALEKHHQQPSYVWIWLDGDTPEEMEAEIRRRRAQLSPGTCICAFRRPIENTVEWEAEAQRVLTMQAARQNSSDT